MEEDGSQGGDFMSQRLFGLPMPVVIIGVAILAYLFISRSSSSTPASTTGGGGTATSGTTTLQSGAIQISVNKDAGTNTQPKPPVKRRQTKVAVPNVVGQMYPAGAAKLKGAGLVSHRATPYVGKVASENPAAGTKIPRGSTVTLAGAKKPPRKKPVKK